jgi:hypothetical protein
MTRHRVVRSQAATLVGEVARRYAAGQRSAPDTSHPEAGAVGPWLGRTGLAWLGRGAQSASWTLPTERMPGFEDRSGLRAPFGILLGRRRPTREVRGSPRGERRSDPPDEMVLPR